MKESSYRLLAKIGSFGITWVILDDLYKIIYPMFQILGFNLNNWGIFFKELISSNELFVLIIYPLIIVGIYIFVAIPLWYFGWKKKE